MGLLPQEHVPSLSCVHFLVVSALQTAQSQFLPDWAQRTMLSGDPKGAEISISLFVSVACEFQIFHKCLNALSALGRTHVQHRAPTLAGLRQGKVGFVYRGYVTSIRRMTRLPAALESPSDMTKAIWPLISDTTRPAILPGPDVV